jgi:uncharacterized surface protein with fasciclin (FAS1) repeats
VIAAELADDLSGPGPFTVFAPTDDAFALLPDGLIDTLLADPTGTLADVLQYHVVSGEVRAADVVGLTSATPLLPDATIDILVDGTTVVLDGRVQVTATDIEADNGIIHIIDAVLVPGAFPGSIADVVAASPRFSTLFAAVGAADTAVASRLGGDVDTTLFAPTNAAFAALPAGTVERLLEPANQGELTDLLLMHALDGAVASSGVVDGLTVIPLLAGQTLLFDTDAGVTVNEVAVTSFDITADNGVVHVLGGVLLPEPPG